MIHSDRPDNKTNKICKGEIIMTKNEKLARETAKPLLDLFYAGIREITLNVEDADYKILVTMLPFQSIDVKEITI